MTHKDETDETKRGGGVGRVHATAEGEGAAEGEGRLGRRELRQRESAGAEQAAPGSLSSQLYFSIEGMKYRLSASRKRRLYCL